jgi:hypothetical protein
MSDAVAEAHSPGFDAGSVPVVGAVGMKKRKASEAAAAAVPAPKDAEEEPKPVVVPPPSASGAPSPALPQSAVLFILGALLILTYSLESLAPTLDYVGRDIMLAVQVLHLAATAVYGLNADWVVVMVLANLAALTRFWRIEDPQSVIFDEVSRRSSNLSAGPLPPPPPCPLFSLPALLKHTLVFAFLRARRRAAAAATHPAPLPLPLPPFLSPLLADFASSYGLSLLSLRLRIPVHGI